jgi:F subunit of K+-transporting ATPase (Potass_KdpF)
VVTVVDCVLLAVSVAAFGYLAVAMFKPDPHSGDVPRRGRLGHHHD